MTDFNFYSETYCGSLIPADAWDAVCRDAEAQMNRYERIYHVSYPQTGSRNMAVCAMAEALYEFAQLQDAGGAVQSVSVGNVSENRAAVAAPDTSAAAQAAELYRRAGLVLKGHILPPLGIQLLHIHIGNGEHAFPGKPLPLCQNAAVLRH